MLKGISFGTLRKSILKFLHSVYRNDKESEKGRDRESEKQKKHEIIRVFTKWSAIFYLQFTVFVINFE